MAAKRSAIYAKKLNGWREDEEFFGKKKFKTKLARSGFFGPAFVSAGRGRTHWAPTRLVRDLHPPPARERAFWVHMLTIAQW